MTIIAQGGKRGGNLATMFLYIIQIKLVLIWERVLYVKMLIVIYITMIKNHRHTQTHTKEINGIEMVNWNMYLT